MGPVVVEEVLWEGRGIETHRVWDPWMSVLGWRPGRQRSPTHPRSQNPLRGLVLAGEK